MFGTYKKSVLLVDDIISRYKYENRVDALVFLFVSLKILKKVDIDRLTKFVEESKENEPN